MSNKLDYEKDVVIRVSTQGWHKNITITGEFLECAINKQAMLGAMVLNAIEAIKEKQ